MRGQLPAVLSSSSGGCGAFACLTPRRPCCCPASHPLPLSPPPPPTDNVIRAGLTPKLRDTEVLCESLTYGQGVPEVLTGAKSAASPHLALYRPPFR